MRSYTPEIVRRLAFTNPYGLTPAEEILARYEGEWGRRTDPLFQEYAF